MMRINKALILAGLAFTAMSAFGQSRPPTNSYLDTRVNTTAELLHEVESDKEVMDRYQRHFAMDRDQVVAYLSGLRVSKLDKDGVYTVYGVPHSSGDFHAHLRLLKKGEPVFVDAGGTPVLQLVCGNPLLLGLPPITPNRVQPQPGVASGTVETPVEASPTPSPAS